jgi:hypothetical protein
MKLYVGITDNDWFKFLSILQPDEVNFWKPSGGNFRAIPEGAPFLFKLHSPMNYIVGGAFFVKFFLLPLSLAWKAFEQKNGAPNFETLYDQIHKYRGLQGNMQPDPKIGCTILSNPFFLMKTIGYQFQRIGNQALCKVRLTILKTLQAKGCGIIYRVASRNTTDQKMKRKISLSL